MYMFYIRSLTILSQAKFKYQSFINQFKDTKYQELLNIKKEARNLQSEINAINFKNQKQVKIKGTLPFFWQELIRNFKYDKIDFFYINN